MLLSSQLLGTFPNLYSLELVGSDDWSDDMQKWDRKHMIIYT